MTLGYKEQILRILDDIVKEDENSIAAEKGVVDMQGQTNLAAENSSVCEPFEAAVDILA